MISPSPDDRRPSPAIVLTFALAMTAAACAAKPPAPSSPEPAQSSPGAALGYGAPGQPQQAGYPPATSAQPGYAPAPPPPPLQATSPTPETLTVQAARDFDAAERELSVAAGDCSNACRALGSMDRAAGRICTLSAEKPRCEDATSKVRTARDKVKKSCGECKETSTDSKAPVPSR